jgi:hypothetical protein
MLPLNVAPNPRIGPNAPGYIDLTHWPRFGSLQEAAEWLRANAVRLFRKALSLGSSLDSHNCSAATDLLPAKTLDALSLIIVL